MRIGFALIQHQRYAHAKQFKRAGKARGDRSLPFAENQHMLTLWRSGNSRRIYIQESIS
jgi:hypothetical protein